jgi:hypothetical protein
LADALLRALEKALFNPKHILHRETFGAYEPDQQRRARVATSPFSAPRMQKEKANG